MAVPKRLEDAAVAGQPGALRRLALLAFAPARLLKERAARRALLAGAIILGCAVLSATIWRNVREDVFALPEYQVPVAQLRLNAMPNWLNEQADVRRDVIRDASLDGNMSLLNERLTVDIARAFALHPWVEQVASVRKSFPAQVDVEVVFRQPVCVVEFSNTSYAVDAHAVLVPRADIQADELARLPRLTGVDAPTGLMGTVWSDLRVIGAAEIAAVLKEEWQALGLKSIVPAATPDRSPRGSDYQFDLVTTQDKVIQWGFAPQVESADEATLAWKLGEIRNFQRKQTAPVRRENAPVIQPTRRIEDLTSQPSGRSQK